MERWSTMRFVLCLLAMLFQQGPVVPGRTGAVGGGGPSNFAYVASSVTGCFAFASLTTCPYALHVNPTTGQLLVCMAAWVGASNTATMSGSNNGSLTAIGSPQTGINTLSTARGQMFYKANISGGAETITLTINNATTALLWECALYTYTGTLSALDGTPQYSTTQASGGVATISGLTTANSSDMIWSACLSIDTSCTVGSGYTGHNDTNTCDFSTGSCVTGQNFNTATGSLIEEKVNITAGAQSATFGTGTTDNVILGLVGF